MWTYNYGEIYHHGILGQRWGKRNGPPYPLSSSDHSASERKAGWRKSLSGGINSEKDLTRQDDKGYNKGSGKETNRLTGKQKKTIAAGAYATDTSLAAIGDYKLVKSDKFNRLINSGRKKSKSLLVGNADEVLKKLGKPETLSETLKNVNPHLGDDEYLNNCAFCSIAGFIRSKGYNVSAGKTGGKGLILGGVIEDCFKGIKVFDGTAIKFGKSRKDAEELLLKRFGDNAEGVCGIDWKAECTSNNQRSGHAFNWKIKNGIVTFIDYQQHVSGSEIDWYWNAIDPNGSLCIARLDNAEINFEKIKDIID